jgi:hypothetical protein
LEKKLPQISMPALMYPIMEQLYQSDCFIDDAVLQEIASLGAKAVPDLQKILEDALHNRLKYQQELAWYDAFFATHALWLLYEADATSSVALALEFAALDAQAHDFWFGDSVYTDIPQILIKLGRKQPKKLMAFLQSSSKSLYSKDLVNAALTQIAVYNPNSREDIVQFYEEHIQHFIKNVDSLDELYPIDEESNTYQLPYTEYIALLIKDLQEADLVELEDLVRECYQLNLVDEGIGGEADDLEFGEEKREIPKTIFDKYDEYRLSDFAETSPYHPDAEEIALIREEEEEDDVDVGSVGWRSKEQKKDDKIKSLVKRKRGGRD